MSKEKITIEEKLKRAEACNHMYREIIERIEEKIMNGTYRIKNEDEEKK